MKTRLCIVGPGAIGGWLAARLALAGEEVSVLARGAALDRIARDGLELHSNGEHHVARVRACATTAEIGAQDVVVVTVKSQSLPSLAPSLRPLLHADTVLLPATNGLPWWYFLPPGQPNAGLRLRSVDPTGELERAIPLAHVVGLSVFASCHCPSAGVVHHSAGSRLVLGEPHGGASERVAGLAKRLSAAGFEAQASNDIRRDIWNKLLGNACFNPVSLLTGAATDDMIDDPGLHGLFLRMMGEAIAVGERLALRLDVDPVQRIALTRRLGHIKTSMLQDLEAGRSVEFEAILGALVECAAAAGVPVPALDGVLALARMRARQAGLTAH